MQCQTAVLLKASVKDHLHIIPSQEFPEENRQIIHIINIKYSDIVTDLTQAPLQLPPLLQPPQAPFVVVMLNPNNV